MPISPGRLRSKRLIAAYAFAKTAHTGQFRRYTGQPYITHPLSVAKRLSLYTMDEDMLVAALLHDTIEDTDAMAADINVAFGPRVTAMVARLTNVTCQSDGNRIARKSAERAHLIRGTAEIQTIKVFDLIDNTIDIVAHDPAFARVYLHEKRLLLKHMKKAPIAVRALGWQYWNQAAERLKASQPT